MAAIVFIFLCIAAAWATLGNTVMTRTATQDENLKTAVGELWGKQLRLSYLRLAVGNRFALIEAGILQFVYLVLFSYTFFFERFTGLAITVLCILTLFVVMQFTGRVDWDNLFRRGPTAEAGAPEHMR
jgi:hypothetical protein